MDNGVCCPCCDGDGEFLTQDDAYTCGVCNGKGFLTGEEYRKFKKEWESDVREKNAKELKKAWKEFLKEQEKKKK